MIERGEKEELYVLINVRALLNVATGPLELESDVLGFRPVAVSLPIM
jgi:hypothetical protein